MPDAWSTLPSSAHLVFSAAPAPCACPADRRADVRRRAEKLTVLDRAVDHGLVTRAEAAERRAHLLAG